MRKRAIGLMLCVVALLASCKRNYEEIYVKGRVVGAEMCSSNRLGYLMEMEYPAEIGDTITTYYGHFNNAVMAYEAPRRLEKDEVVYGVAYVTRDYAALHCVGLYNYTLPEIVLLSADEDSTIFTNNDSTKRERKHKK